MSFASLSATPPMLRAGFRFGPRSTLASRTIMLRELTELFAVVPPDAAREEYAAAVVNENALGKRTHANRRATLQRLTEMYGVSPEIALFRVLRHVWRRDSRGHPLLAMLCALARDPLLRASAHAVLRLPLGDELVRSRFRGVLRKISGTRFNEAVLDKVARNAASSWAQSGHLQGRMRKTRRFVQPTPGAVAVALWLGQIEGRAGFALLDSDWAAVLDSRGTALVPHVLEAKRLGLIHARVAGSLIEIDVRRLDPGMSTR